MNGLKAFPECKECQCYPECRIDCPDHGDCLLRLPGYLKVMNIDINRTYSDNTHGSDLLTSLLSPSPRRRSHPT
jgi:hypothetical protein